MLDFAPECCFHRMLRSGTHDGSHMYPLRQIPAILQTWKQEPQATTPPAPPVLGPLSTAPCPQMAAPGGTAHAVWQWCSTPAGQQGRRKLSQMLNCNLIFCWVFQGPTEQLLHWLGLQDEPNLCPGRCNSMHIISYQQPSTPTP